MTTKSHIKEDRIADARRSDEDYIAKKSRREASRCIKDLFIIYNQSGARSTDMGRQWILLGLFLPNVEQNTTASGKFYLHCYMRLHTSALLTTLHKQN